MSKAILYAILAPIGYALANVLLEYKFSKVNNLTLIIVYGSVLVGLAIIMRFFVRTDDPSYNFPTGREFWFLLALGFVFFVTDYLFIGAYTNGGDIITITALITLFPVFASIFKLIGSRILNDMTYATPNAWQIGGYALAVVSVILVVKGAPST